MSRKRLSRSQRLVISCLEEKGSVRTSYDEPKWGYLFSESISTRVRFSTIRRLLELGELEKIPHESDESDIYWRLPENSSFLELVAKQKNL